MVLLSSLDDHFEERNISFDGLFAKCERIVRLVRYAICSDCTNKIIITSKSMS